MSTARRNPAASQDVTQTLTLWPPEDSEAEVPAAPVAGDGIPNATGWGWFPALSLVAACGLLCIALAFSFGRLQLTGAPILFWSGVLIIMLPAAWRLLAEAPSRRERLALVVMTMLAFYAVKILHDPLAFSFHDEFLHWRTANDIIQSGHLFQQNTLLPVSPLYPGFEAVTAALATMSGLSIFWAGLLVVGAAHLVMGLSLYLFCEQITGSGRLAGVAAITYAANPGLLFFDGSFSYESLALPLMVFALFTIARQVKVRDSAGLTAMFALAAGAVVITHHLTSYALIGFLCLWTLFSAARSRFSARTALLAFSTLMTICFAITWLYLVAHVTLNYLSPVVRTAIAEILKVILREETGRQPFQSYSGEYVSLTERLVSLGALLLTALAIPAGLVHVWLFRRRNAAVLMLAAVACIYPATQVLRLTRGGGEFSSRSPEFLFLGIGCLFAGIWVAPGLVPRLGKLLAPIFTFCIAVLLVGGIITGWGPTTRIIPGVYRVAADSQSIEPQSVAAALWARAALGPNNRMAADRTNRLLMGSYGGQYLITNLANGVNIAPVFFAAALGPSEQALLDAGDIRYLVIDRRLSEGLPLFGVYFENGEPGSYQHMTPIDPAALDKFDQVPGVSRVFDSGNITIYDVGAIYHAP